MNSQTRYTEFFVKLSLYILFMIISQKKRWDIGNNLLFHAIAHGDAKDVLALLEDKEAQPNCTNVNGATPLHFAVYYQNKEILELLIKYGANPNVKEYYDVGFCTPLHRAIERNNYELCKILLAAGADPNIQEKNGFTALHYAARKGFADIVKLLLDSGVDVNKRDSFGNNASYWAKAGGFTKVMELLPPPARITSEELHDHWAAMREVHEIPAKKGKKKKGKKKKK